MTDYCVLFSGFCRFPFPSRIQRALDKPRPLRALANRPKFLPVYSASSELTRLPVILLWGGPSPPAPTPSSPILMGGLGALKHSARPTPPQCLIADSPFSRQGRQRRPGCFRVLQYPLTLFLLFRAVLLAQVSIIQLLERCFPPRKYELTHPPL